MEAIVSQPARSQSLLKTLETAINSRLAMEAHLVAEIQREISVWEDQNFAQAADVDPSPEALKQHKEMLDHVEMLAKWLLIAADQPEYPIKSVAEDLRSTLECVQIRRNMWHHKISDEQQAKIIALFGKAA
jgi:hypothetical protein